MLWSRASHLNWALCASARKNHQIYSFLYSFACIICEQHYEILEFRVERVVQFLYNVPKWKSVVTFVGTYSIVSLGIELLSPETIQLWPNIVIFFCVFLAFLTSSKFRRNPLLIRDGDVYLHGIQAELKRKHSFLGYQYIQVTALTEKGYHRIKVFEHQVVADDWVYLSEKCT